MAGKGSRERLKGAIARVAPELARALGGPLAGAAVRAVSEAVLGRAEDDEAALADAVLGASPDALAKLRTASLEFQAALRAAAVEEARIDAGDRADARAREVARGDLMPGVLAAAVVVGFFSVLGMMLLSNVPSDAETEFSIMLGALATMAASVMNYYFGSSVGSKEKTLLLGRSPRADT